MSITSNIYANYVLGQHPIAFWTLDESLSGTTTNIGSSGLNLYSTSTVNAYEANTYNYTGQIGYYVSGNVSNTSFPIVYGSYNSTLAKGLDAIILPAFGFLNSAGKNNTYTFETWLKVSDPYTAGIRKLIGCFTDYSTESDDNNGLYFNETSFILRIGDNYGTHYIKDFNKPMFIQLSYSNTTFSLTVNSETLIELNLSETDIAKLKQTSKNYIMLSNAMFDSAALYNYIQSKNQIKLNYSQALNTAYPNVLISKYDGKGFKISSLTSKYSNSIKFPTDLSGQAWKSGFRNHMQVNNSMSISPYKYDLPIFNFSDSAITKTTLETAITPTFQFKKPSSTWVSSEANINFNSLDILYNDKVKAFYLDATFITLPTTEQTVFKIIHKETKEYFKISMDSSNIYYKFKSGTNLISTLWSESITGSSPYNLLIGIDIDKFAFNFTSTKYFFHNLSKLSLYVAGEETLATDTTFTGLINSVKFLNSFNLAQRSTTTSSLITTYGTFKYDASLTSLMTPLASYDLDLFYNSILSKYYFTVGTSGYWKNHIPLQSLATYTTDASGNKTYSIDFIQFNIDYAAPTTKTQVSGNWIFDTIQSSPHLKTYITFEDGISTYKPDSFFTTQVGPKINRVVNPGSGDTWKTTKYEVVDDFIIYMPDNIDISRYYIMASIEMSIPDTLNNDLEIKSLEFLSKTLSNDATKENPVSVSQGELIPYSYTSAGGYNYKTKNPFIVNKKSEQYLQLSRQSGIRLVGDYAVGTSRGIRYKINKNSTRTYNISTLQMFIYYEGLATRTGSTITKVYFPTTATEVFKIQSRTRNYKFYIQSTNPGVDDTQGIITAIADTGITNENIVYYINGIYTTNPIINANEWTVLGIVFIDKLDFNSYSSGYLDFTGPLSFDNISFYQLKNVKYTQSLFPRKWGQIQTPISGSGTYTWNSWIGNTWNEISLTGQNEQSAATNMGNLYKTFVGNNILVNDIVQNIDLGIIDESHVIYDAIVRQSSTYSAS